MPRYYCDYCDTYLTHDSPSVRKQHNAGYKHKANVRNYYQQFEEQQTQSLIDQRIKEHLGQAAAFQVGAPFNQHLLQYPGNMPRPRLPILPTPMMQHVYPQHPQPGGPFARPPILPVPGAPGSTSGAPPLAPAAPPQAAFSYAQSNEGNH
ncbi:U1 small nuclear ribonucleoprotein C-1-like isoform X2 [Triticum dicoccoides]|uniref:U1 small nuclear ribonucleoprotein C-1-like isoform X2 n=1 Tax=Triticum dicoccoides TaxID=85692 RepID=UPI0018910329|nr:U1 small nuclear ribonucleoprotein C-1-like isoform X2 [Triticum dicoccoides]